MTAHTFRMGIMEATVKSRKTAAMGLGAMATCWPTVLPVASSAPTAATKPSMANLQCQQRCSQTKHCNQTRLVVMKNPSRLLTGGYLQAANTQGWQKTHQRRKQAISRCAPAVDDLRSRALEAEAVRDADLCVQGLHRTG